MKTSFLFLSFLFVSTILSAQTVTWSWDLYKIQFTVPSDFKVSKNDKAGFAAGNAGINLTIYPQENPSFDIAVMNAALENWATSAKLTYTSKAQEMIGPLNGFKACFLDAKASNGLPTTVLFLSNPNDTKVGYYVWLQYQQDYGQKVGEIMLSLAPTKGKNEGAVQSKSGMTEWTWDAYKVKYKAPSDFKISKSDDKGFSAGNERINLTIYPDESKTQDQLEMAMSLEKWANSANLSYDGFAKELTDLNRYLGYYITGIAPNGNPTTVVLLSDPDFPTIGLYVWVQYKAEHLEEALKIITSFTPN